MTSSRESGSADGPQVIVELLRAEILEEDHTEGALGVVSEQRPPVSVARQEDVDAAVDALMAESAAPPSQELQVRLTQRVAAVLAGRRLTLPALLEDARITNETSTSDLASALNLSEERVRELESGVVPLWQARDKDQVGLVIDWIRSLGIDWMSAGRAAHRLVPRDAASAYGRAETRIRTAEARSFVDSLEAAIAREVADASGPRD